MISKVLRAAYCVILALLAGCAELAPLLSQPTPAPATQAAATPQPSPAITSTASSAAEPGVLRVWLPPRFDPSADTTASKLLKQRLAEFQSTHTRLIVEVRIRAEEGETSLLNSLALTSQAASSNLPDLIALPRPDLESAALQGLLHPVDGLSTMLDDPGWVPYARSLGHIQNIGYGLPFAGEALVMAHRPELQFDNWDDILASKQPLLFPAGDPLSVVALALYVSAGGKLTDEQNQPTLEETPLTETLNLIQNGLESQTFSPSLLNLKTDEQSLQAYRTGRANAVITWFANYQAADGVRQAVPGLREASILNFADGWMWALAGSAPEKQQVATELAEYLMEDPFLSEWISATGFLPTRLSQNSQANDILEAAQMIPSNDVLAALGPIMNQALNRVLNGEQVSVVVRSVMEQVK
jgi:ABC-type glycerol-3-phosphate transport system substrate-binding protein